MTYDYAIVGIANKVKTVPTFLQLQGMYVRLRNRVGTIIACGRLVPGEEEGLTDPPTLIRKESSTEGETSSAHQQLFQAAAATLIVIIFTTIC